MMWNTPAARSAAPLVSCKAGTLRATPVENRFRVEADERRGLLLLEKGGDGATHIIWKDRQTLQTVHDLLVFPGDQSLSKVDTGRPSDRVYLLTFRTSASRRLFFWMQEPDASKDEERVKEFNRFMNDVALPTNPLRGFGAPASGGSSLAAAAAPAVGLDELSNILSGLGYDSSAGNESNPSPETDSMNVEEGSAPSSTASGGVPPKADGGDDKKENNDAAAANQLLTEEDLIRALEGPTMTPSLARVVNGDALDSLLDDADEDVKRALIALLPEGHQTEEELRLTFRSPQLRQTLVQLSRALNSENLNIVIATFGLDARAGAHLLQIGDGIGAFLAALEDDVEREEQQKPS